MLLRNLNKKLAIQQEITNIDREGRDCSRNSVQNPRSLT